MADRRNTTDASRLNFPLQLVIVIAGTAITVYAAQAQIRSDVRDLLTTIRLTSDVQKAQAEAQQERFSALKTAIDTQASTMQSAIASIQRRQEMQQIQIAELKDAITKLSSTQAGRK